MRVMLIAGGTTGDVLEELTEEESAKFINRMFSALIDVDLAA